MTGSGGSAAAIDVYEDRAACLTARYDAIPNERLYAPVRHLIPARPARVADIGAATGRDARWFADMGHAVTAVEPASGFLNSAREIDARIDWVQDRLPGLPKLRAKGDVFDFINLMGVWHHLDPEERARAAPVLRGLVVAGGLLCLALRIGPVPPGFPAHPIDPDLTADHFDGSGFQEIFRSVTDSIQETNRAAGVRWVWLVLRARGGGHAE